MARIAFKGCMTTKFEPLESTIQAPIGAALLEEDTQVIQSPGWYQLVTPSLQEVSVNEVILSRMSGAALDRKIEETFALYKKHNLPFKWAIGPMSSPEVENKISVAAAESWHYRGMYASTDMQLAPAIGLTVERVSQHNFTEFLEVFLDGWSLERFREQAIKKFTKIIDEKSIHPYFLARKDGVPVACAGTVLRADCGYLVGAVVLEAHRGCGAYRALIQERLIDLKRMGIGFAVTQAREATSAPILEKQGFLTAFRAKIYKFGA
jgi:N-acetylglutamate synthase-like GNAT family acetyltransferase